MVHICNAIANLGWTWSYLWAYYLPMNKIKQNKLTKKTTEFHLASLHFVMFLNVNMAWTSETGLAQFQCWYRFVFHMKNVYAPSDTSVNNIYDRNASCHFWCCKRIYLSFPLWYSTNFSHVVWEYLISLNAIQKNLLSNKSTYFTIYCCLSNSVSVWVSLCFQRFQRFILQRIIKFNEWRFLRKVHS